jgi:NAD+ kinase
MKTAAIISKPDKPELHRIVPELLQWLVEHGYTPLLDRETAVYAAERDGVDRKELAGHDPDFAVVLGGDGTLLSAGRVLACKGIPIIAVNLGSLGFLTEVPLSELYPTLEAVHDGACPMESRAMVHCEVIRDGQCVAAYDALNDAVVNKIAIARLVSIDLYVEGNFVSSYNADGVIVATPTGSTAYSLAAGGPILMPSVEGLVITPICPHALTNRPLVVRDTARIEVVCHHHGQEVFLSIDGQAGMQLEGGDRVVCRKSDQHVKLLRMHKTFFEVLRAKLKWGQR